MKVSIIVAPKDFRDETLSQLELLLDKKGIGYEVLSLSNGECTGMHGATVKQKERADEFEPVYTDAVVIVDGKGIDDLRVFENRALLDRLKVAKENKKVLGAIGNGVKVLAKANIIKNAKIAAVEDEDSKRLIGLYKGQLANADVVASEGIVTAKDNSHMLEFVDSLSEALGVK
ncbi:MAG: DJ-1/PfpI family protein [Candidatus Micrarchaeia archaeon]